MITPHTSGNGLPVRGDLRAIHQSLADHLASPGTWWTGPERLAIAASARAALACALCADRKRALSPYAVDGIHDDDSGLDPVVVDTIHRIVTDPGRLTRRLIDDPVATGHLDHAAFVELLAVTIFISAMDVFALAVGADPVELPAAREGEPDRRLPTRLEDERAWVPRLVPDDPAWVELYGEREQVAEVERGLSLVPAEVAMLNRFAAAHYMRFENVTRPHHIEPDRAIDRMQTEFVAARVSAFNDCFY